MSYECKKVLNNILGEIEFLADFKSTGKMTHFKPQCRSQLKVFTFLWNK